MGLPGPFAEPHNQLAKLTSILHDLELAGVDNFSCDTCCCHTLLVKPLPHLSWVLTKCHHVDVRHTILAFFTPVAIEIYHPGGVLCSSWGTVDAWVRLVDSVAEIRWRTFLRAVDASNRELLYSIALHNILCDLSESW